MECTSVDFLSSAIAATRSNEEEVAVQAGLYCHSERKPMLLEMGDRGRVRCTSLVRGRDGKRMARRTAWHGEYSTSAEGSELTLIFSCRLVPTRCPRVTMTWDAKYECWKNEDVVLHAVPAGMWYRFTCEFPLEI